MIEAYKKRLLKELKMGYRFLTATDFAVFWKRSKIAVGTAAIELKLERRIKIGKDGVLSLR